MKNPGVMQQVPYVAGIRNKTCLKKAKKCTTGVESTTVVQVWFTRQDLWIPRSFTLDRGRMWAA